jgi:GntR family transcriptional regulator
MHLDLDHTRGGTPLYLQLANALGDVIVRDRLAAGDQLPSETVLAADNQLSRATVIKAYDLLIERGLVTRRQGKGTFVTPRPMARHLPELTSFSEHVHGLGLTPSSTLLRFESFAPGGPDRPASPFEDDAVVVVERLRSVDGAPVGIHRVIVREQLAEQIGLTEPAAAAPSFSFYSTLHQHGVELATAAESMQAVNASEQDAELLRVEPGTALIEVIRESRDTDGHLIEHVRARYLGSKYIYRISFAPTSHGEHHDLSVHEAAGPARRLGAGAERLLRG